MCSQVRSPLPLTKAVGSPVNPITIKWVELPKSKIQKIRITVYVVPAEEHTV